MSRFQQYEAASDENSGTEILYARGLSLTSFLSENKSAAGARAGEGRILRVIVPLFFGAILASSGKFMEILWGEIHFHAQSKMLNV